MTAGFRQIGDIIAIAYRLRGLGPEIEAQLAAAMRAEARAQTPPEEPTRRVGGPRLKPEQVRQIKDLYAAGRSVMQIAKALGLSRESVSRHAAAARAQGVQPVPDPRWMTPQEVERARQLHSEGHSVNAISRALGRSHIAISKAVRDAAAASANQGKATQ